MGDDTGSRATFRGPLSDTMRLFHQRLRGAGTREEIDAAIARLTNIVFRVVEGLADDGPKAPDGGPYCERCHGARMLVKERLAPERGIVRSEYIPCPACEDVMRQANIDRAVRRSRLSTEQRTKVFGTIEHARGMETARMATMLWAAKPDGWLVIYGVVGSGKTHLGLAVVNALIERGDSAVWWYASDVVKEAQRLMGAKDDHGDYLERSPQAFLDELQSLPLLVLDDLGGARPTDWALDCLERMLDRRYRDRRPTLITCKGSPAEVKANWSEAIGRRMQDDSVCRVVHNTAPQWRES